MYAQILISLREAFEAALLIAIVLLYLRRMGLDEYSKYLLAGGIIGIIASGVAGVIAYNTYLLVEEKELAEAVGAFIAVPVLTSVIYWMAMKGRNIKAEIEREVERRINLRGALGIFSLGIVFVFREGLETVIFLLPLIFIQPYASFIGVWVGIAIALFISYMIFIMGLRLDLRKFFYFTSILIVFVASGILGYGIHELVEYGEDKGWALEPWSNIVYNLNLPEDSIFHEKGLIGGILAVLFGYASKMELIRLLFQFGYLVLGISLVMYAYRRR